MGAWIAGLTLLALFWSGPALAAMGVEVRGAVGMWSPGFEGEVDFKDNALSTNDSVDLGKDARLFFWLALEHPAPLIPCVKLSYVDLDGRGDFWADIWGQPGPAQADISARIIDLTLYWHLPLVRGATLGGVDVTYGLNGRWLATDMTLRERLLELDQARRTSDELDLMLYAGVRVRPVEWLSLEAEARGVTLTGHDWRDLKAGVQLYPVEHFFLGLGYRDILAGEDLENTNLELSARGWYGEVGFSF